MTLRLGRSRAAFVAAFVAALVAAAVLLAAGCGPNATPNAASGTSGEGSAAGTAGVAVDTPALRAAKKRAGIETCPGVTSSTTARARSLPDITLPCLGGGPDVTLSNLRGPMVVNLWAQWCGPCRQELPYYEELHKRAGDRVKILGIDYQDTRPDWAIELMRQTGVTYPSLADPAGDLRVPLRVRGLPGIVFLDKEGRVVHQEFAVIESYRQLADLVRQHLGVAVGTAG